MFQTRSFVPTILALCGSALATALPANADIITTKAVADASVMSFDEGAKYNFGSDPFLLGYNDHFSTTHILLQFKIAKKQASSIRSARLCLWSTGWVGDFVNTAPTSVFALATPWRENEVNWYYATSRIGWKNPGGDVIGNGSQPIAFATNTEGMRIPSGGSGMIEWDVTELVRLWASGKLKNNGLRIDVSDGIFLFESRESVFRDLRPTLILDIAK